MNSNVLYQLPPKKVLTGAPPLPKHPQKNFPSSTKHLQQPPKENKLTQNDNKIEVLHELPKQPLKAPPLPPLPKGAKPKVSPNPNSPPKPKETLPPQSQRPIIPKLEVPNSPKQHLSNPQRSNTSPIKPTDIHNETITEYSTQKQTPRSQCDIEKHLQKQRASVGSTQPLYALSPRQHISTPVKGVPKEPTLTNNFFKKTTHISPRQFSGDSFIVNTSSSTNCTSDITTPNNSSTSPKVNDLSCQSQKVIEPITTQNLGNNKEETSQEDKEELKHSRRGIGIFSKFSKSNDLLTSSTKDEKKKEKKEKKVKRKGDENCGYEIQSPRVDIVIQPNDFLKKYETYIINDDAESKIRFIPKNRIGEKVNGSELLMHTAELIFTEFMFCARLQIFKTWFEDIIKKEIPLLKHQEDLLFGPLDSLVDSISRMCLELEPLYYELLDNNINLEDKIVLDIILKYYAFVTGVQSGSVNLSTSFLPFVAHYTSLATNIDDFIKDNKQLNKLVTIQVNSCIDKNIKQFADLYFAPTQRICRYELLLSSILKEIKDKECKTAKYLNETIICYKEMNVNINELIFKSKYFYLKRYEYLDQIYKSNKPIIMANIVNTHFDSPEHFVSYYQGYKGVIIGNYKIELCIFYNGILRKDIKTSSFEFYPIETIYNELTEKEEDSLTENDIYFYDAKKKKSQIITMTSIEQRDQFNFNLRLTYDHFIKSHKTELTNVF
ncbi:Hypothetical protein EHI5A_047240 [Entamoeba histolytica KU27]|uniref:DH domain-containing protein n=1 Tax=Entamoeba histolytica KU27 TaxID=885311 RepID=M2S797_ENTHI|nr:Hypothetical protein EHI5A_047240 [Entamoeba histolytica KU27]